MARDTTGARVAAEVTQEMRSGGTVGASGADHELGYLADCEVQRCKGVHGEDEHTDNRSMLESVLVFESLDFKHVVSLIFLRGDKSEG